jgi:hypothetical protein
MTVESVTYISDLDDTNPVSDGTDFAAEGDNHIRNIKTGLAGSFPNFVGAAVTATEAELNLLDGKTSVATLGPNTFTDYQVIASATPSLTLNETDATTDSKIWQWIATDEVCLLRTRNDAYVGGINVLTVTRSGLTPLVLDVPVAELHNGGSRVLTELDIIQKAKTADETVTSSTVVQADDHLVAPLEAGTRYAFELFMIYSSGTSGGLTYGFTFPTGSDGKFKLPTLSTAYSLTAQVATNSYGNVYIARIDGTITTAATPGNLGLAWAQSVSDPVGTTIHAGSWLRVTKAQ